MGPQERDDKPTDAAATSDPQAAGAEPSEAEVQPELSHDEVAGLQQQLEQALAKADEHWNQLLRVQAEIQNTRRRAEQDVEKAHRYSLEKFAAELLPVKDSLEMGLAAAQEGSADADKLMEGTELTLKMLAGALEKFSVTEVNPLGERFDPARHEAMATQPSAEAEPNTVLNVVQKGYLLNDRVLRPAMVIVSRAP